MFAFILFLLAWEIVVTSATTTYQSPQHVQLFCDTKAKQEWLSSISEHLDIGRFSRSYRDPTNAFVDPSNLSWLENQLQANNVTYQLSQLIHGSKFRLPSRRRRRLAANGALDLTTFPRYDEVKAYLKYLEAGHNDLVSYLSIGTSWEGRQIVGVKISTGGHDKPGIFIEAGMHAREWIAPSSALYLVEQLVENSANRHLIERLDVYVVPLVNPDGYEFSHLHKTTRFWRKTRSKTGLPYCNGVDGNRNFDFEWKTVGSANDPCRADYAGPMPFSEPETRAIRDFILGHKDKIKAYLSLHAYGNYFLYPWGSTNKAPKHESMLRCVAEKAEAELAKVRGTRYTIDTANSVLYPTSGGSSGWAMAVAGIELTYTLELPGPSWGFVPPASEVLPVAEETFEAIKVFMGYARGEVCQELRPRGRVKVKGGYDFFSR